MTDWNPLRWAMLVLALLIIPAMAVREGWTYRQLVEDGVETMASISAKRVHRSGRSSNCYRLEYTYRDGEQRRRWGHQCIDRTRYDSVRIGQPIMARYSRTHPDVSVAYLGLLRERVKLYTLLSMLIGAAVMSATWWLRYARRKTHEYDVAASGLPA
jgi:hypothetical protein